jgi:cyclopropane fatty-acyl-phospholipid synthase-like methyltransferase
MDKPHAPACERNREPILNLLREYFADRRHVLEVGSGTGQHAVFFAEQLPHLIWRTSDQRIHHEGIRAWIADSGPPNVLPPLDLDVTIRPWPVDRAEAVFSANTVHIMGWPMVRDFIAGVGRLLPEGGLFLLYGPFSYDGVHTSESNARFDVSLKARDPRMGVRDFRDVDTLAAGAGMTLVEDNAMPANNRLLVWRKLAGADAVAKAPPP